MATTLNDMANRLQEYIVKQQENAAGTSQYVMTRYSSVKLKMESPIRYPHVIVEIGISKAIFNLDNNNKTDGGLGPFERYVRKWLENSWIKYDLRELYKRLGDKVLEKQKPNNPRAVVYEAGEADPLKPKAPEWENLDLKTEEGVKKYLKHYLRSSKGFRR